MEISDEAKVKARRSRRRRAAKFELDICYTENCRLLPNRFELLKRMPRNGIAAEIGAAFGEFTDAILQLAAPAKLHLVDLWEMERYQPGLEAIRGKFADAIAAERLAITQGYSTEVLKTFPDGYFDWVYIDTNHSYATTRDELALCGVKVKPGGLIAGHDFCEGNVARALRYGVIEACAEFCITAGWQYHYLALDPLGHFSFCLKRR